MSALYSISSVRSPSGCTGRALIGWRASMAAICAGDASIGVVSTLQVTASVQGGVVSEPR